WIALAEDTRLEPILAPLVGFIDVGEEFEPAEDIGDRLDWAAANIPRAILLLRKIAKLRDRQTAAAEPTRYTKPGRNQPCPCGSGRKYKRCCGQS
ncbi:MAG: SEC-C metal-binding domain-containing protein, partial [Terriglobia bacterium]